MKTIDYIREELEKYVRLDIFNARVSPLERILYGLVALILTSVAVGVLSLVIIKK